MASTIVVDKLQATGGVVFTLPTADGSAGHLLKTNGSAVLSFTADTDTGILTIVEDTTPQLGGFLDPNDNFIGMQKGGDITSASPTVVDTDGDYFDVTGTVSFTAFTVAADRHFFIQFDGILTMTHHVTNLDLPGGADITTAAGDVAEFFSTGANTVQCVNYTKASGTPIITDIVEDTTPQLGGDLSCNGAQIQWSKGADVVSATALVLLTDGNYFDVTGTVTITSFNTTAVGTQIKLHFDAACILTHHSSDLILPSGANITTAAGDEAEFIEYASGDYRCTNYTRASGKAVIASHSTTIGVQTIWVPALAMVSPTTNGAEANAVETTATKPEMKVLDFHQSTVEYAQFSIAMPKSWNEGTVTAKFYWTHATAVATNVVWGIQGVCVSDNDTIDATFGTGVTVTDTFHNAAEDLAISPETAAITLGGTPAEDDLAYFQVYRNSSHGDDTTNSTDARLLGVKILFTTNAENDA